MNKLKESRLCSGKVICMLLAAAAILLNIKYIFVDFGIDAEYQIVMAYRLAKGELMFKEMWEINQMSAFLCAFFIKIYLALFQTTTGMVLYLQIVGVLLDAGIALLLYHTASKYLGSKRMAFAMAWLFFIIAPKDVPIAEYANMQIWFSMLLVIALFVFLKTGKKRMLILAALALCGAVLAYPSCLLLVAGILFLFIRYGKKQDFLLLMAICAVAGICYMGMILRYMSPDEFFYVFENMRLIEVAHAAGIVEKFGAYLVDAGKIALFLGVAYGASMGLVKLIGCKREYAQDKEKCGIMVDCLFFMVVLLVCVYTIINMDVYVRYCYALTFIVIIMLGMRYAKRLTGNKHMFYICGTTISLMNFLATLVLTDLELVGSLPYLLIALVVAILPIGELLKNVAWKEKTGRTVKVTIVAAAIFLMFRNAYVIRPMYLQAFSIFEVGGIVKNGPALGMISDYMGAYMQNESMKEWEQYIEDGSKIYLIGDPLDVLGYLYADTEIAAPTVMCTPGYNEGIAEYWKMNPDKYPDVVVASCWYGTMNGALSEDSWIRKWLEEEFQPTHYTDGKYWRYYYR